MYTAGCSINPSFKNTFFYFCHLSCTRPRPLSLSSSTFCHMPYLLSIGISSHLSLRYPSISVFLHLCSISQILLASANLHRFQCFIISGSGQTTSIVSFRGHFYGSNVHLLCDVIISNMVYPSLSSRPSQHPHLDYKLAYFFLLHGQKFRIFNHCWRDACV